MVKHILFLDDDKFSYYDYQWYVCFC